MSFQALVYTDCRAAESMSGTAGMGFRSCHPGPDPGAMALVQQKLLYEVPENWMRESRPVADFPRSYAHTWDRYLASTSGMYLGRELSSARQGNHLTHAIVTTDPTSYGLVRPAQLVDAPFWIDRADTATATGELTGRLPRGPFDAEAAQTFVRGWTGGAELLLALLTALEQVRAPGARRVLFIDGDSGRVMRWLAAATLLLPQHDALRIGFKVFTTDPAYATHHVLAVHPAWNSSVARVDNDLGYVVFDLTRDEYTPVPPSPRAFRWVRWFLDEDPYDVVDAVEVAATVGGAAVTAPAVAAVAVLGVRPQPGPEATAVVDWLRTAPTAMLDVYGPRILDVMLAEAADWPPDVADGLRAALSGGRLGSRPGVTRTLLDLELDRAVTAGTAGPADRPAAGMWPAGDRAGAEAAVAEALRRAPVERVDAVLRVAGRFGLPVDITTEPVRRFVRAWADDPSRSYDPAAWPGGPDLVDRLRTELSRRIDPKRPETSWQIGTDWWRVLPTPAVPPVTDLDYALVAARTAQLPTADRQRFVESAVDRSLAAPGAAALNQTVEGLWTRVAPRLAEVQYLRRRAPAARLTAPAIRTWADQLVRAPEADPDLFAAFSELVDSDMYQPDPALANLLTEARIKNRVVDLVERGEPAAEKEIRMLSTSARRAIARRAAEVLDPLFRSPRPHLVVSLLAQVPELAPPYVNRLEVKVVDPGAPQTVVQAVYLLGTNGLPPVVADCLNDEVRDNLEQVVRRWIARTHKGPVFDRTELLARQLGGTATVKWHTLVQQSRRQPGEFWRNPFRRGSG